MPHPPYADHVESAHYQVAASTGKAEEGGGGRTQGEHKGTHSLLLMVFSGGGTERANTTHRLFLCRFWGIVPFLVLEQLPYSC